MRSYANPIRNQKVKTDVSPTGRATSDNAEMALVYDRTVTPGCSHFDAIRLPSVD